MQVQSSIGTQFTLFLNLPPELRLRIWELASATPRSVRLRELLSKKLINPEEYPAIFGPPRCFSILHVCRDSRDIALKTYSIINHPRLLSPLYFNLANDILLFTEKFRRFIGPDTHHNSTDSVLRVTSGAILGIVIERTILQGTIKTTYKPSAMDISFGLISFPQLKEFIIVLPKVEPNVLRVFYGESNGGDTAQIVELNSYELRVAIRDWVTDLKFLLRLHKSVGSPELRNRLQSAWWANPQFTIATEEQFQARFPVDG
jgi:hypothetical protein